MRKRLFAVLTAALMIVSMIPCFQAGSLAEDADPMKKVRNHFEGAKIAFSTCNDKLNAKFLQERLDEMLASCDYAPKEMTITCISEPEVYGEHPLYTADVELRYKEEAVKFKVGGRLERVKHVFSRWWENAPATCEKAGEEGHYCIRCGIIETRKTEPLGHIFGDWIILCAPTTAERGIRIRICKRCYKIEREPIKLLPDPCLPLCDMNRDGSADVSDVTVLLDALQNGTGIEKTFDLNGDGLVNITDVTALLDILSKA